MMFCLSPGDDKNNSCINVKDSIIFLLNAKDSVDAVLALISVLVSIRLLINMIHGWHWDNFLVNLKGFMRPFIPTICFNRDSPKVSPPLQQLSTTRKSLLYIVFEEEYALVWREEVRMHWFSIALYPLIFKSIESWVVATSPGTYFNKQV